MANELNTAVSLSMKLNLGNYESAEVFFSVSGISADTTPEDVATILDGPARFAYDAIKERLRARIVEVRTKRSEATT